MKKVLRLNKEKIGGSTMIRILENLKTISIGEAYHKIYENFDGYDYEHSDRVDGIILDTRSIDLNDYLSLKVISRNGVGLDNIDLEECKKRNIIVKITDCEELSKAVAEHALYLILRLLKNKGAFLYNKTIGIIGLGRIGFTFYKMIKFLVGKYPITYDIRSAFDSDIIFKEKLLKYSDIVVICTSGNEEVIGQKEIDTMKQGSYIVNVAREKCVDDKVITSAILNGYKINGYASDVNGNEEIFHGLLEEKYNIIYTPHIASLPAKVIMERQCVDNLIEGLKEWKK